MGKGHLPHDRLVDRKRDTGMAGHEAGQLVDLLLFYVCMILIQHFKCHYHFFERRVTRTFAKTVYRYMGTGSPVFQSSHRVSHGKAEVIMAMDRQRRYLSEWRDEFRHFFRSQQSYRIAEAEPVSPVFYPNGKQ